MMCAFGVVVPIYVRVNVGNFRVHKTGAQQSPRASTSESVCGAAVAGCCRGAQENVSLYLCTSVI